MITLLSIGKTVSVKKDEYLRDYHKLSNTRIKTFDEIEHFFNNHKSWLDAEFVKVQREDQQSNSLQPIQWGRNRPADAKLLEAARRYMRQCGNQNLADKFDLKVMIPFRLLNYGAQKIRMKSKNKVAAIPKPNDHQDSTPVKSDRRSRALEKALRNVVKKQYGPKANVDKIIKDFGQDIILNSLRCSCHEH